MGWFRRRKLPPTIEFGCDYCANDDYRYYEDVPRIAFDDDRGLLLQQCPKCGALYEQDTLGGQCAMRRIASS